MKLQQEQDMKSTRFDVLCENWVNIFGIWFIIKRSTTATQCGSGTVYESFPALCLHCLCVVTMLLQDFCHALELSGMLMALWIIK